ncbi:poly-gamma-glutamate hydrolase family protein [Oceanobacillus profundus]|uniref:Replication protein n=1 Tax=Oceanobacillus profundus TaxID=372463 RepID=A0A417YD33_9BACI|nr:poly-gamma-glutamate hydrolase family protein [Oceanobacillus profundus]MBR3120314.1 poly-gamma-glutamate hydrolase family protein [Oceanobacillus sp.]PAE27050.1 replication protein [Paenibacillus sp. 7884-2]RHW30528.1 replication protein [Oceanobacillus profundus]
MNKFNKYCFALFLSSSFLLPLSFLTTVSAAGYYDSYEDLKEHEVLNEDYEINYKQRGSDITVIAIHGGGIEPGTSEVAKGLANQMNISYYLFAGIKSTNNEILHLTSKRFDEPTGRRMVQNSVSALSIHGYQGEEPIIYLGGRNEEYKELVRDYLQNRGFQVEDAPDHISGMSEENIVNDNQLRAGVQLELTAELRKSFFKNHDWSRENRHNTTNIYDKLIDGLKEASDIYKEQL